MGVVISHAVARRSWRLAWNKDLARRLLTFSWPIWLSAIPLMAVFQGDRMIIGHYFGVEALAGYTAVFMMTMVPGLIASRVSFSLVLPMLSQAKELHQNELFVTRLALLSEATALMTGLYAALFLLAGSQIVTMTFGPKYDGLYPVVAALAVMWSTRMLQAVPGTALMALGPHGHLPDRGLHPGSGPGAGARPWRSVARIWCMSRRPAPWAKRHRSSTSYAHWRSLGRARLGLCY